MVFIDVARLERIGGCFKYNVGRSYRMTAREVGSIQFSRALAPASKVLDRSKTRHEVDLGRSNSRHRDPALGAKGEISRGADDQR